MLQVQKSEYAKGQMVYALNGVVDDSVDLTALLGPPQGELHVDCSGVQRLNSVGIKSWISYFDGARQKGTKLFFHDCSPAIIEQVNMIQNFLGGGKLVSLQLPYTCVSCSHRFTRSMPTEQLRPGGKVVAEIVDETCPKCGESAEFDDLIDSYLGFLSRK